MVHMAGEELESIHIPPQILDVVLMIAQLLSRRAELPASPSRLPGPLWSCMPDTVSLNDDMRGCRFDMIRSDALPVHYVFPRRSLDINHALECLVESGRSDLGGTSEGLKEQESNKGIIVVWEVAFDWLSGKHLLFI